MSPVTSGPICIYIRKKRTRAREMLTRTAYTTSSVAARGNA